MDRKDPLTVRSVHAVEHVSNVKTIQRLISAKVNEDESKKENAKRCSVEYFERDRQGKIIEKRSRQETIEVLNKNDRRNINNNQNQFDKYDQIESVRRTFFEFGLQCALYNYHFIPIKIFFHDP